MKKFAVLIFAAALVTGLVVTNMFSFGRINSRIFNFSFGKVHGSGDLGIDKRDLTGFHGIDAGGVFQIEITAQKEYAVEIQADDNLLPLIRTEVRGGILRLSTAKRLQTSNPIRVFISAPDIYSLEISGASNVSVADLKNSELSLESSGVSKVRISGETERLKIDVSGATRIDAGDLMAKTADVDAAGASSVILNVTGQLKAEASGASRVSYAGPPQEVIKKTSGASSIGPQ